MAFNNSVCVGKDRHRFRVASTEHVTYAGYGLERRACTSGIPTSVTRAREWIPLIVMTVYKCQSLEYV